MARAKQYADRVDIIEMVKVSGKWPFARIVERNGRTIVGTTDSQKQAQNAE